MYVIADVIEISLTNLVFTKSLDHNSKSQIWWPFYYLFHSL